MKVCIIPARGGSKRIPRKNIKDFCGKPMLARAIETAKNSQLFEQIIVSTDDSAIAISLNTTVPLSAKDLPRLPMIMPLPLR